MRHSLLILGLFTLAACDAQPPTEPNSAGETEINAKWETVTINTGRGYGIDFIEDGRLYLVECLGSSRDATRRTRIRQDGSFEERTEGSLEAAIFSLADITDVYPPADYLELTSDWATGRLRDVLQAGETSFISKTFVRGSMGGQAVNCSSDYEYGRTPETAERIIFGDRCWESPPGNSILPCPTP